MKDDLVQEVYIYLTAKRYPDGVSEGKKRVIRKKATKFMIGELLYKHKKKEGSLLSFLHFLFG